VWTRGILQQEYGLPLDSIEWVCELDETIEFTPRADFKIERAPADASIEQMLADGEIDAVLHPDLIRPLVEKDPRIARLFLDYPAEELAFTFYHRTGIFPIMRVLGIRRQVIDRNPWVAINLFYALDKAKNVAMKRLANPRVVPLAFYWEAWEEQERLMGPDPWEYGLSDKNRHNLQTLVGYAYEQGLTQA
jgi:4,5-dihydroxyphthalate decarboxylase